MEDEGEEPGWEVWLGGGKCLCHLLTILVPNSIAVLPSIAILLEKGQRSCCLFSTNFFTPQLVWSLWGLDIVFGGTCLRSGWCQGPWGPSPLLSHISCGLTLWVLQLCSAPLQAQSEGEHGLSPTPPSFLAVVGLKGATWVLVSCGARQRCTEGQVVLRTSPSWMLQLLWWHCATVCSWCFPVPGYHPLLAAHWEGYSRPWNQHWTAVNYKAFLLHVA